MGQILLKKESFVTLKGSLETLKGEFDTSITNIKTNLENVSNNWKGKKANETLSVIEALNKMTSDLLIRVEENIEYIKEVITTIDKVEGVDVEVKSTVLNNIPLITPIITKPATYGNSSQISPLNYTQEYMDSVIYNVKNGISPFANENMVDLSTKYNQTVTIRDRGSDFFKESEQALKQLQDRLRSEKGSDGKTLWGTPAATEVLVHFMLKTGIKIPSYPTKKQDTVGNYRYLGLNTGWLDDNNGLDCNNLSVWININSGRMPEGKHFYVPKSNQGSIKLYRPSQIHLPTGGEAGDLVSRENHVGTYAFEDEDYIYVIEAANTRTNATPGSLLTMLPKDGKSRGLGPNYVLYPKAHFSFIVKEDDIFLVNNPASIPRSKK